MTGRYLTLIYLICRLAVGVTFIYAALGKWGDPRVLANVINGYGLLPPWMVGFCGMILPWLELSAGALLIFGFFEAPAAAILLILESAYTYGLARVLASGRDVLAGVFSTAPTSRHVSWGLLAFSVAMALMTFNVLRYAYVRERARLRPKPGQEFS